MTTDKRFKTGKLAAEARSVGLIYIGPAASGNKNKKQYEFQACAHRQDIGMKPKEQINFLNELLSEKDGPSLAAILDAPKAATGLAKDHANRMWEAYTKAAAPDATAALSEYNSNQDADQASMRTASRAADDLNDPREIQRIVAEQDKAREAEQKLNQALE